ncbi:MAG: GGDEF domain-containing protein [Rhodospirillales bacterium]|nr:GGDEF domain-containing protein [Rhodospirillales bacterium]
MPEGGEVTTHEDITELRRSEARVAHMAYHDALTGLANRALLRMRLNKALAEAQAEQRQIAVLCLDLNRFKEVNDCLGHSIGDSLLKTVADRLRNCVAETDTVARLGGDEFVVVSMGADAKRAADLAAAHSPGARSAAL